MPQDEKDELAEAQLKKLKLEIEDIERRRKLSAKVIQYIPLITTLLAVAGLVFSMMQAQRARQKDNEDRSYNERLRIDEQAKERANKIQSQMRVDKEQLLDFITDDKISVTRTIFLLRDLESLANQLPNAEVEKEYIANFIMGMIRELDFNQERHVFFESEAFRLFDPYSNYLKALPPIHKIILDKYFIHLNRYITENSQCAQNIIESEKIPESKRKSCRADLFIGLVTAIQEHVSIMEKSENRDFFLESVKADWAEITKKLPIAKKLRMFDYQ